MTCHKSQALQNKFELLEDVEEALRRLPIEVIHARMHAGADRIGSIIQKLSKCGPEVS
jgi:hypothetical protein